MHGFHPAVRAWFERCFDAPTAPQERAWPAIRGGQNTLIAAPTGSGKTLAAFLSAIDELVVQHERGELPETTQVVYVSPLKALSNDIRKNLRLPLEGIAYELGMAEGTSPVRVQVRTGDTPAAARRKMVEEPPHILVTTPESLYILLTSEGGRRMLGDARTLIVDEIHAVASDKRGSHLALTIERLEALVRENRGADARLQRIGLSATQRPIEDVARYLVGASQLDDDGHPDCAIVDTVGVREMDLDIEMPPSPLEALMAGEVWEEVYDRLAELIEAHRTTLLFVNTRRMAERIAHHLATRVGEDLVTSHHGSLSTEQRLDAERRLKSGELRALVATASLELGIDIGAIDLVVQIGSPSSINTLLQRVGRASHHVGGVPKGRLLPLSRDDLVESVAAVGAVRRGQLDRLIMPDKPIDILAQQIVACAAARDWGETELYELVRRAYPFRDLTRHEFDEVVDMLADGFTTRRGQRGRYLHLDAVNGQIRGRRGARLTAITCGGAIPDNFEFKVVQEPDGLQVGTLDEDFSVESLPGDIFQLGNASWRILRVETGVVRVEDARGLPPTIPFWFGEAPGRTRELSEAVSALRADLEARLGDDDGADGVERAASWLAAEYGVDAVAARAVVDYLAAARTSLGTLPTRDTIVMERFFDEAGDMHLVIHSPFGTRVNRAWGLALRKVFCRTFNFELQAAATDDALVLSLGPTHSFPLQEVFGYLRPESVRDKLVQAFLDAPMFPVRWRWNAARSLAVKRWVGGRRLAPHLQRMDSEDLLAVIFPDSLACFENIEGAREVPEHPLVDQTIRDCLEEAMDFEEFVELLGAVVGGAKTLVARDLREPSPLAHEILTARPYAFLDDAPAEERRTLAVQTRRRIDPESADDLSALDAAAIERVREEARPEAASADELHDALLVHGFLAVEEIESGQGWPALLAELADAGRATTLRLGDRARVVVAAERLPLFEAAFGRAGIVVREPEIEVPERARRQNWNRDDALRELVRGRLQALGPVRPADLALPLGLTGQGVEGALLALEAEGFAFRGRFTPGAASTEWCERRLLARIHRYTLHRLRAEIEPVSTTDFMRFLLAWHGLTGERVKGPQSLEPIVGRLEGFEAAAAAWEAEILPARLSDYDPVWLDTLCLSGRVTWCRRAGSAQALRSGRGGPIRSTPITLLARERLDVWRRLGGGGAEAELGREAEAVRGALEADGASFFADLARRTGLLDSQVETGLGELVARGLVTSDSFTGLRALLVPSSRRRPREGGRRKGRTAVFGMDNAGRWSLVRAGRSQGAAGAAESLTGPSAQDLECIARLLLQRYGVVFRRLLRRESGLPPWRELLRVYYRLEDRGEIRGGRFVAGFQGQQFALPEAVAELRRIRRQEPDGTLVSISAADPLNLVGVLSTDDRVASLADNRVLFRDGLPVAVREAGAVRHLVEPPPDEAWRYETALVRRELPPKLRPYLGRSA